MGERRASADLWRGDPARLPPPPLPSHRPLHRGEMLTPQAARFMNMTLKGKQPSRKAQNYVIIVIKELKKEPGRGDTGGIAA